ncbi:MAG: iduronate-2-sulfatase [Rickettsiales bacterium]|nr:iduronate-2-sulfatase [Rickettsiales bacterium]
MNRSRWWLYCLSFVGAIALLSCSEDPPKMNVLLIISDDLNNNIGAYGHPLVQTPNIDQLAQEGVKFTRAYCQLPLCGPSRVSILTGLYPDSTNVFINETNFRDYRPDVVTLPQLFMNNGYFTARVGKLFHYGVPGDIGTDGLDDTLSWNERRNPKGRDKWDEDQVINLTPNKHLGASLSFLQADGEDKEQTDGMVATEIIDLLSMHQEEPFFIASGFFRPHCPYIAPKKYFDLYDTAEIVIPKLGNDREDIPELAVSTVVNPNYGLPESDLKLAVQAYYASISFMDAQVGRILNALDSLGLKDNTIVVFTSDHGYNLGEHGLWHKFNLFEEANLVPLIVSAPGHDGGGDISKLTEMVDLYPSLAELAGLDAPKNLNGRSFVPLLTNPELSWRRAAHMVVARPDGTPDRSKPNWGMQLLGRSVRTDRWRYTEWKQGEYGKELYDHVSDPKELTNLAMDSAYSETVSELKELLKSQR